MAPTCLRFALLAALCLPAFAQEKGPLPAPAPTEAAVPQPAAPAFTPKGADTCLKCHDEDAKVPVLAIFKTPHGQRSDARTPFAQLQCESCHGAGGDHAQKLRTGEPRPHIRDFGLRATSSTEDQNGACLTCHQGAKRIGWNGSAHESGGVPCAGCHQVHVAQDPVTSESGEAAVCASCHARQRAEHNSAFAHPVRQGKMSCSGCHAAHGTSLGPSLLAQPSVNETCFTCHADKRGPFLWEHAPAAEDCTLCHRPHGSNHRAMLDRHAPLLCQQCHSPVGHPSVAFTPGGLPSGAPSAFLLGNSCTNCHSQVHGSNHPSGAQLLR